MHETENTSEEPWGLGYAVRGRVQHLSIGTSTIGGRSIGICSSLPFITILSVGKGYEEANRALIEAGSNPCARCLEFLTGILATRRPPRDDVVYLGGTRNQSVHVVVRATAHSYESIASICGATASDARHWLGNDLEFETLPEMVEHLRTWRSLGIVCFKCRLRLGLIEAPPQD